MPSRRRWPVSAAPPVPRSGEARSTPPGRALSLGSLQAACETGWEGRAILWKAVPLCLAALPFGAGVARALLARGGIWLWGDQAVIDLEARDSLLGRNLLGVYDRYGWHHPGPLWLLWLGIVRWVGGGAPEALVVGSFVLQGTFAVAIVLFASRLQPGRMVPWLTAIAVVAYEWDFGPGRFGTVWAPYAITLPAALLVLVVVDAVTNDDPWPGAFGSVLCASFLVQTDIGTGVLVAGLCLFALVLGSFGGFAQLRVGRWRLRAGVLGAVAVMAWMPPLVQQLASDPGNLGLVFRFFTTHSSHRSWHESLRVVSTLFGTYPLQRGPHGANVDAALTWLAARPVLRRPWYLLYLLGTLAAGAFALSRGRRKAAALAAACVVSLLAAAWSVHLADGDLYPYIVVWMAALAVPAWVSMALAFAPGLGVRALRLGRSIVPAVALAVSAAVTVGFAASPSPMGGTPSQLGRLSWEAVSPAVLSPGVRTIYVDIAANEGMPEAAAIADNAVRRGRRVEVNGQALYFFDPSFAARAPAQVKIVVCCGKGDPGRPPPGVTFGAQVGGQAIYLSRVAVRAKASS